MCYLATALSLLLAAAAGASSLTPPTLPLFVRNPYLSTWLGHARDAPWDHWPMFYTGAHVGFSVMAYVPASKTVYPLLGRPHDSLSSHSESYNVSTPSYGGSSFDASTTNLTYQIEHPDGGSGSRVRLILSFLSPITPTSTLRQAIPASYLSIHAEGTLDVHVYVDANGDWVTGNRDSVIEWGLAQSEATGPSRLKSWKVSRKTEQLFSEFADRGEWGTFYFAGPSYLRHASGESSLLRQEFAEKGHVSDQIDTHYRKVLDREPVFAFSHSFKLAPGNGTEAAAGEAGPVVLSLALVQDPVVQFASARGLTHMTPLWVSYFGTAEKLLRFHHDDFAAASGLARNYSDQLARDAFASGARDYRDIAALSARQVLGATQFAGTRENPLVFLKEISSNGNMQTVDVIFPAFPFFLYTNPRWLAWLLEPLLEHQLSGQYPNQYSMHDLGTHFPNATGHADGKDEYMPVEECGNMVVMGLALANALRDRADGSFSRDPGTGAQRLTPQVFPTPRAAPEEEREKDHHRAVLALETDEFGMDVVPDAAAAAAASRGAGDAKDWLVRSYKLWDRWTGYLVREALIPHSQLSTDDFAGWLANQTNLALKGIIGIRAMGEIADLAGRADDARQYRRIAEDYIGKWQEYGIARDGTHAKLAYTWYGSWTTTYNLFADSLLCFHLPEQEENGAAHFIPDKIYDMQSRWYANVLQRYGLPLDGRHLYAKSDWEFFAAAVTSKKTRGAILQSIARWVNETATDRPLTDLYDTEENGGFPGITFFARPVVGGHFAFLALERACRGKAAQGLEFLNAGDAHGRQQGDDATGRRMDDL